MSEDNKIIWVILLIGIIGINSYISKNEVKEFNKLSLDRMQFIESNLIKAQSKLDKAIQISSHFCGDYSDLRSLLCNSQNDISNALIDLRPEIKDLNKRLEK